jgi:IclR family acetate operon transcriptional repressor
MENDKSGRIQSVDRAMILLEALGREECGYRLSDLARATELSVTTVHRLLTTLQQRQFVQFSKSDNMWHIGAGAFTVGSAFQRERNIIAAAGPFLRRLREQTRETANVGIANDHHVVIADQMLSREHGRAISTVGGRTPMTASGMGKVFLSSYLEEDVATLVARRGLQRITQKTLTSFEALASQLARIKAEGFSIDDEEYRRGVRCVAAPIFNGRREIVCAISVSGSSSRITADRLPQLAQTVKAVAADFSELLRGAVTPGGDHGSIENLQLAAC